MSEVEMLKRRTMHSMTAIAYSRARRLWADMRELADGPEFDKTRDEYYAMFRNDRNFIAGTEPYQST